MERETKSQIKILLVDDETDIIEFLTYNLKKEGYNVFSESSGKDAIKTAQKILPDLIVLDIMMPEMDGIETCNIIRQIPVLESTSIIFLTARSEDYSQIAGFDAGADDFIAKPISPKVFVKKINALLKRLKKVNSNSEVKSIIEFENLIIDKENHIVVYNGNEIVLPKKEFNLLFMLASFPEKIFSRDEIYSKVWGNDVIVGDRTIDVHIRKIREKTDEKFIKTVKGVGYKFSFKNKKSV
jgi:two-component system alkaline phosphatase synthesis response regulator PhoP